MSAKKKSRQSNFRLSEKALRLLSLSANRTGMSKTEIVEASVLRHAAGIPGLADEAKKMLVEWAEHAADPSFEKPERQHAGHYELAA